jgi:hypothetical protein
MNKETYQQKIEAFLKENQYSVLNKDPTMNYQKQIIRTIQQCKTLNLKQQQKLTQIEPKLNARIKEHKTGNPIRPVVNYRQGPAYLLTPWSRVLFEKLKRPELLKKFPAFYGTRRFITAFTRARLLSLS